MTKEYFWGCCIPAYPDQGVCIMSELIKLYTSNMCSLCQQHNHKAVTKRKVGEERRKSERGEKLPHVLRLGYFGWGDVSCEKYRGMGQ